MFPALDRERREREHVGLGGLEQRERVRELAVQRGANLLILTVHRLGVGLFEHALEHPGDHRPRALRGLSAQVVRKTGAAAWDGETLGRPSAVVSAAARFGR